MQHSRKIAKVLQCVAFGYAQLGSLLCFGIAKGESRAENCLLGSADFI